MLALALHPDADAGTLTADVDVSGDAGLVRIYVWRPDGRQVAAGAAFAEEGSVPVGEASSEQAGPARRVRLRLDLGEVRRWSPDDPCLYDITVRFGTDVVRSYTAFRTVKVAPDGAGRFRFFLNGEPLLLRGVLDQGYWSDGLMTAPSDAALAFDIQAMRDAGFNMVRKHLKVEGRPLVLPLRSAWHAGVAGHGVGRGHLRRLGNQLQADAVARELGRLQ